MAPPVEQEPGPRPKMSIRGRLKRRMRKLIIWLLVIGALFGVIILFQDRIVGLLRHSPTTWAIYSHISAQISAKTLLGLFYAGLFGALFFIMIPLEAVFFYYLGLSYHPMIVVTVMWISSLIGLTIDYLIGAAVGEQILARFATEKFLRTRAAMERWGGLIVVVSNLIPFLPVQFISLGIGATRYGLRRFFFYTMVSRFAYVLALWLSADYFRQLLLH